MVLKTAAQQQMISKGKAAPQWSQSRSAMSVSVGIGVATHVCVCVLLSRVTSQIPSSSHKPQSGIGDCERPNDTGTEKETAVDQWDRPHLRLSGARRAQVELALIGTHHLQDPAIGEGGRRDERDTHTCG